MPRTSLLLHQSEPIVDVYEKMFCILRLAYEKAFTEHDWTTLRLHLEGEVLVPGRSPNMQLGLGDFVLQARRATDRRAQSPPSPPNSEHHCHESDDSSDSFVPVDAAGDAEEESDV